MLQNETTYEEVDPVSPQDDAKVQETALDEHLAEVAAEEEKPTILVMHASVGSGHRSAAEAVAQALELLRDSDDPEIRQGLAIPENLNVEVIDVLDIGRVKFDGDKTASMFTGATRPIYDLTWRYTFTGRLLWGGGTIWCHVNFPTFAETVRKVKPLAIVATHIVAANVAVGGRMLTGQQFPVVCVPTDYETEGMWPHLHGDVFCVANMHMVETLRPRLVPINRVVITGLPCRPAFAQEYNREETRERYGLPQDKHVVLALAGARLPQPYVRFRSALDNVLPYMHSLESMHLVIVAGDDKEYSSHLRTQVEQLDIKNVTILDYVDQMAALMSASDLVICKSGGLVVTECLCAQVPMILLGKAYGQENINVRMLTSMGAAMHVTTPRELVTALKRFEDNPASMELLLINGAYLRKPDAALDIARLTIRLSQRTEVEPALLKKHFAHFYWGKRPAHTR